LFCLIFYLPDGSRWDRSEARGWASGLVRQAAPPLPRFPATRLAPPPPPAHAWSRRHPLGVVGEPAAGRIPSVPSVDGWNRLGASSRPQIGHWDRRQCHMPDFWVTGRPRNPLNAPVATFCAAGVISMHQTPPGMVRGGSLGSLGGDLLLLAQAATASGLGSYVGAPSTTNPTDPTGHTAGLRCIWTSLPSLVWSIVINMRG
jgi:hypothetical protein